MNRAEIVVRRHGEQIAEHDVEASSRLERLLRWFRLVERHHVLIEDRCYVLELDVPLQLRPVRKVLKIN